MKYEWRFVYNPDLIVVAKSLKMRWNPSDRCWWTEDAEVGVAIAGGNEQVIALAKSRQKKQEGAVALSKATNANIDLPCPEGLMYLPYQKAGIAYSLDRQNVLIADEMGLGKTIQAIGLVNADPSIRSVLVLMPASLRLNWEKEIRKWEVSKGRIVQFYSEDGLTEKERKGLQCLKALDSHIRNYGGKASDDVFSTLQMPSVLDFFAQTFSPLDGVSRVSKTAKRRNPIYDSFVGVVNNDAPRGMAFSGGTNTTFTVDNASKISQVCGFSRGMKGAGDSLLVDSHSESIAQSSQFDTTDSKIATNSGVCFSASKSFCGLYDLGNRDSGSPMPVFSMDDTKRLPRQFELFKDYLQCAVMSSDFFGSLAECDLAILYALRYVLRLVFCHSKLLCCDWKYLLLNYDILNACKPSLDEIGQFDLLIADECHRLKNPKTIRSQLVLGHKEYVKKTDTPEQVIAKMKKNIPGIQARRKVFLTGTPIVNRPIELFPLLTALDPEGLGKNFFYYAKRYTNAQQTRYGWDFSGEANLADLNQYLRSHFMIRRLKADVLKELPRKRRQIIVLPTNGLKSAVAMENKIMAQRAEKMEMLAVDIELGKASEDDYAGIVRQLAEARELAFAEISAARRDMAIAKAPFVVEYAKDLLEEETTKKIIIFAHHHEVMDLLATAFGDTAVKLDGRMGIKAKQAAVDRFQTDDTCKVFVGSIQAAGVGITLTAANVVIFAELDWVPGNITQAEDRAHRIGQLDSVLVQHLVVDGSIDAKMAKFIVEKQEIIDRALDNPVAVTEIKGDVVVPIERPGTASTPKSEIEKIATRITSDAKPLIDRALSALVGRDIDRASTRNDVGFNKIDGELGHRLVNIMPKSNKQYALALKLCWKYNKTQLGGVLSPLESVLKG